MENNLLAIVIPYYKIKYFQKTLEGLKNQTCKNFSLYIGDDASPDSPLSILYEYENVLPHHYTRFEENWGMKKLVAQWERCIDLSAEEPWIMILGDDDEVDCCFVENFYKHLENIEKNNIQVVRFASCNIDEKGSLLSKIYVNPSFEKAKDSLIRTAKGEGRSTLSEHIFSRKAYLKHRFKDFPVAFGSDNVAWLEFPEFGDIYSINESVVRIRISPEHLSSTHDEAIRYQRRKGVYVFIKYIIKNYYYHFSTEEREILLKKAYRSLRYYSRSKKKAAKFVFFMMKYIRMIIGILNKNRKKTSF